jgi:phospholipid/cholesterol/gamma-HCH transport system substrate-binding protein
VTPYALSRGRVAVVVVFALSCFGILLYLWSAFGGTAPLRPQGYRITVGVPESDLLTAQADVRISGVSVGRVVRTIKSQRSPNPNRKDAVLQIDTAYAPLANDVKATIRRKSLAGEMYLELTPGSPGAPRIADGGRLPEANVAPSVELDEIFRAFDPRTRRRLRTWMGEQALSIDGSGRDLSDAFGNAAGFEEDATDLLRVLRSQEGAVRQAVRGTGEVFAAISQRRDALRGLMVNGRRATDSLARQHQAFADTWRAFPAFELESRKLLETADAFAHRTDPVVRAFQPAWREFSLTMQEVQRTAPDFRRALEATPALQRAAVDGLPAAREFLDQVRPLIAEFSPFLRQFTPIVAEFDTYREAVASFFANTTAITQGLAGSMGSDKLVHYARGMAALSPETLSGDYKHRLPTNRANPYGPPGMQVRRDAPLPVFDSRGCGPDVFPALAPETALQLDPGLVARINKYALNDGDGTAPPCVLQRTPDGSAYHHLLPLSPNR